MGHTWIYIGLASKERRFACVGEMIRLGLVFRGIFHRESDAIEGGVEIEGFVSRALPV